MKSVKNNLIFSYLAWTFWSIKAWRCGWSNATIIPVSRPIARYCQDSSPTWSTMSSNSPLTHIFQLLKRNRRNLKNNYHGIIRHLGLNYCTALEGRVVWRKIEGCRKNWEIGFVVRKNSNRGYFSSLRASFLLMNAPLRSDLSSYLHRNWTKRAI